MVPQTASTTPRKPGAEATGQAARQTPHQLALPVHRLPPEASDGATNSHHSTGSQERKRLDTNHLRGRTLTPQPPSVSLCLRVKPKPRPTRVLPHHHTLIDIDEW